MCKILDNITIDKNTECWNWNRACDSLGYGHINYLSNRYMVHRLMWKITNGSFPYNFDILHKCDNRGCCNPQHLFLGTAKDNYEDMVSKNRGGLFARFGEENLAAKLTESQVIRIKNDLIKGIRPSILALRFNITPENVQRINRGEIWKDVGPKMNYKPKPRTMLTERTVIKIKELLSKRITATKIAEIFNTSQWLVYAIKQGKSWKHV